MFQDGSSYDIAKPNLSCILSDKGIDPPEIINWTK